MLFGFFFELQLMGIISYLLVLYTFLYSLLCLRKTKDFYPCKRFKSQTTCLHFLFYTMRKKKANCCSPKKFLLTKNDSKTSRTKILSLIQYVLFIEEWNSWGHTQTVFNRCLLQMWWVLLVMSSSVHLVEVCWDCTWSESNGLLSCLRLLSRSMKYGMIIRSPILCESLSVWDRLTVYVFWWQCLCLSLSC